MNETQGHFGTGLLAEVTDHFSRSGWGLDTLRQFRMEMNPGDLGGGNEGGNEGQGGQQTQQPQGNPFLNEVQESHRPIVEPYLKKWDADVTRRFQELHSQYEPYKNLNADPEELANAYSIYQQLNEDPQGFYAALAEAIGIGTQPVEQGSGGQNGEVELPFQGLPEDFQQDYQQTRSALEAVAQFILEQQTNQQEQQEDAELDSYISNLKQTHGEFDEEYVLAKMYATGCSGEEAIQAWQGSLQKYAGQATPQRPNPRVLGGGGSVPSEQQSVTNLSRSDTKNLVAEIMRQATQEH